MQRYFTKRSDWEEKHVSITGDDAHHIVRVMRFKLGDEIICNHPDGKAAICKIVDLSKDSVKGEIIEWLQNNAELPVYVTIAQALPKGNKLDFIIQKSTELGVNQLLLYEGDRSIAKWDEKKSKQKLNRYRKVMKEASEQCHRNIIPEIEVTSIDSILEQQSEYDIMMYAYENEAKKEFFSSLGKALLHCKRDDKILVFIGPEGGFSEREIELFKKNNCQSVRLGARILRTETAAMYVLASVSYHFEELRCHECPQ